MESDPPATGLKRNQSTELTSTNHNDENEGKIATPWTIQVRIKPLINSEAEVINVNEKHKNARFKHAKGDKVTLLDHAGRVKTYDCI